MKKLLLLTDLLLITALANCHSFLARNVSFIAPAVVLFVAAMAVPLLAARCYGSRQLRFCEYGATLLKMFLATVCLSICYLLYAAFNTPDGFFAWLRAVVQCTLVLATVFWIGIICVYLFSYQLGIKLRIIGIIFGMWPIVNLVILGIILKRVEEELTVEQEKYRKNLSRASEQVCKTQYPILLVHGVFFRDNKHFNYWGRIPDELKLNGATIFYGEHASASSIKDSARELAERIKTVCREHGCEKVNIIAHSKGGLDCRYAIANCGISHLVASLTTINTPHRGCKFADCLLDKVSDDFRNKIAQTYNNTLYALGEPNADFLAAVNDLTSSALERLNPLMPTPDGIFCRSLGSKLEHASGGRFPLNLSYHLVKFFDGENDGLVGEDSFEWGSEYTYIKPKGKRGISHADMIDLGRENLTDFDVRELYVRLVAELKLRGL